MKKIQRCDLYSLEEYAANRESFRTQVMQHKKNRRLAIGPHVTLYFEDRLTIQYQIQEMLRIEKTFTAEGINDELKVYNPLVPDGRNWKATMMIEFGDPEVRAEQLAGMIGIEDAVWLRVDDEALIRPIADEDLERATENKTSAVHFLRFELTAAMVDKLKAGTPLAAGIDHAVYNYTVNRVAENIRISLTGDLD